MRENNTLYMGYSIPEENLYSLLKEHYSEDDIIRQYSDERYPFNCDFYIKSLDLFIELNAHWTHNTHPFDETNKEDLKILELWKSKNTKFYTNAIKTWTQRDVEKLQIAKNNNLNYLSVYNKITDKDIVYSPLKDGEHLNIGVVII